ncbi:MAG: PfkB family carbohydrate kinase [Acidobacteriota bacterium]|nr:MAG: PfkB family carbohydrate kinase [Acidobacteriota bacterium]
MTKQHPIEFVAVGHVTIDRVENGRSEKRLGGAAAYAALAARHLGVNVALVTSAGPDFPYWDRFTGIHTKTIDSEHTTELEHRYLDGERHQRVHHVASAIRAEHVLGLPVAEDAAVLYCPVVHEVEAPLTALAPRGLTAVAPQGFFRQWDDTGRISTRQWDGAERALEQADIVCMSEEDTAVPEGLAETFAGKAFVVTQGSAGCRVYAGADIFSFPALPAQEVDATGAGDVLAASLVVALRRGDSLTDAVRFATREAAAAVEFIGTEGLS